MKYTVGSVPYLNAKPLVRAFEHWAEVSDVQVVYEVPAKLPALLAAGSVQAIMVSSIEAMRRPGSRIAAGVCIGSQKEVLSVRVFSKVSPERIQSLALDQSSMTSNALAQIVLRDGYGASPSTEPRPPSLDAMLSEHDACVLIGDNGMREQGQGLYILDLGLEWFKLKNLPFVWAVWLGDERLTPELAGYLADAERWGQANIDSIIAEAPQPGIPIELCDRYFREIMHYPMGERELAGLQEFGHSLQRHGFLDQPYFPTLVTP
jgi:chorismate dehydratase